MEKVNKMFIVKNYKKKKKKKKKDSHPLNKVLNTSFGVNPISFISILK